MSVANIRSEYRSILIVATNALKHTAAADGNFAVNPNRFGLFRPDNRPNHAIHHILWPNSIVGPSGRPLHTRCTRVAQALHLCCS